MRMKISVTVCDVCEDRDEPTTSYDIKAQDGRKVRRDLCAAHSQTIEALLDLSPAAATAIRQPRSVATKRASDTPRKRTSSKVSIEEIEKLKSV